MEKLKRVNIGIIGAGTMCRAHSLGYDVMPKHFYPCAAIPVKKLLCDINLAAAEEGADRYGWEEYSGAMTSTLWILLFPMICTTKCVWKPPEKAK